MSPVYPFDDAATARAVIDDAGTLVEWNEGARLLLGWPAVEVVGRPATDLLVSTGQDAVRMPERARDVYKETELVVTPLTGDGPHAPDDPLDRAELVQSPCA
ncbi:PAS domain-containing protein, partial [Streptomyces resistomycificus]|uniref:PAS domain-containing protein n=1 Tax=Streptomyces resistomycificus TaxID=67356 RepID=UPI0005637025